MIDRAPRGLDRWRRSWLAVFALVLLLTTAFLTGRHLRTTATHRVSEPSSLPVTPSPSFESAPAPAAPDLSRLLQYSGRVPTLRGCVPNAWPRLGNRFLTGPPV